jgi:regulatory protein
MPQITKISEQKRQPNRRSVFLDGSFAFGCNLNVIARFRLRAGMTLSAEQVEQIEQGEVRQGCVDDALKCLSRRLHSRAELSRKLARRLYAPLMIDDALDDLVRLGYVDDERFARTKALSAAQNKHHGRRRARAELLKAGVGEEVAEKALDAVYSERDSLATVRELASRQAARLRRLEPLVARRRLAGMLQRRGFEYEAVKSVIDEFIGVTDPAVS